MAKETPVQFKGTTLKIILAHLQTADPDTLHQALAELTGNSPDFFENELAVLDFSSAAALPDNIDWAGLRALIGQSGLSAVATRGLNPEHASAAAAAGLPPVSADALGRPRTRPPEPVAAAPASLPPAPTAPEVAQPAAAAVPATRTVILDKPLRSGQRFYARASDLVVTAMVSAGAEVIADGNIHVYAPLRGRALAGAGGDKEARIFTTSMEAELISIAGLYRTFEGGVPGELLRQPATASLQGDGEALRLSIAPLAVR